MPEMTFTVRWPDGRVQDCYSPSLVMWDHLEPGATYPVADLVRRSTTALDLASARVAAKYGFACTSAAATTAQIREAAGRYADDALAEVVAMSPSLPDAGLPGVPR